MDARDLLRVQQKYIARKRMLDPARYCAMQEFRDTCAGAFDAIGMVPGRSPDEIGKELATLEQRAVLMQDFLSGAPLDEARLNEVLGVSLAEFEALKAELNPIVQPVPERLVLMTFDDATVDHLAEAAPILEKYGGKGNFFVCEMEHDMFGGSGFADKSKFMTWEQIKELSDRGHEIVNHSMHHENGAYFNAPDDAYLLSEATDIEARCEAHGVPKPTVFGYPGGQCAARHEVILHELGYLWARGDMQGDQYHRAGTAHYDPLSDSPLALPSFNNAPMMTRDRMTEVIQGATDSRVAIFAYHTVTGRDFSHMTFEEQVALVYELGGRCITFRELAQYIDPVRAYAYTH
jgi:peptidoglycan/xylan/chitin deacetylase (PgdA/CDA1 family)